MRIDVLLGEAHVAPADVADHVAVVIDVRRAATIVAAALDAGARAVIPFETADVECVTRGDGARGAEMAERPFRGGIAPVALEAATRPER